MSCGNLISTYIHHIIHEHVHNSSSYNYFWKTFPKKYTEFVLQSKYHVTFSFYFRNKFCNFHINGLVDVYSLCHEAKVHQHVQTALLKIKERKLR